MSCVKYLCIDDQPAEYIQPLLERLRSYHTDLNFERMHPQDFAHQFERIQKDADEGAFFGLLVDLRLDQDSDSNGNRVYYRGPTLAQELRTRMAEGELPSFPIVLWSMNDNIVHSYAPDSSSHDLFDAVYAKDNGRDPLDESVACELVALAVGYQQLKKLYKESTAVPLEKIIGLIEGDREYLDPRLVNYFKNSSVYEVAGKIINALIRAEGVLISEGMLAARLGIDIDQSGGQWHALVESLNQCKYTGVFQEAWPRWWMHRLEAFWSELVAHSGSLRKFTAVERVSTLNEKLGFELVPATPIVEGYSSKYSTVCVAMGRPLDPADGFKVNSAQQNSWQDSRYVSAQAVLTRVRKDEWSLDPLELERFKQLMDRLKYDKKM